MSVFQLLVPQDTVTIRWKHNQQNTPQWVTSDQAGYEHGKSTGLTRTQKNYGTRHVTIRKGVITDKMIT